MSSGYDDLAPLRAELLEQLGPYGQEHLLRFWDELSQLEKMTLAMEIARFDLGMLQSLGREPEASSNWRALVARAEPPAAVRLGATNQFSPAQARQAGEAALLAGHVGAILVAGGQGTRLGMDHPKGMFPIGPVSRSSLFQILIEKLVAAQRRYGAPIPLFLMTSPATHEETVEFLAAHGNFGLSTKDLIVFSQGTMPAVDCETGRILLASQARPALSPDGHGGVLAALVEARGFEMLRARGIEHLYYFQVDNPLANVCDPEFLGYHLLSQSELSTLAVAKRDPRDRVGNIVSIDGRLQIIEYSEFNDLPDELIAGRAAGGSLLLWAGNTAIHAFAVEFLERMSQSAAALPLHRALKKVPYLDDDHQPIEPSSPNAYKFERFIFDLLPQATRAIVVEADERSAFAPVKNAPGELKDTPESVQAQMIALHSAWLRDAGAQLAKNVAVEIRPLFALDSEELREKLQPGLVVSRPTYFA